MERQSKSAIASSDTSPIKGRSSIRTRPKASHNSKLPIIPSQLTVSSLDGGKNDDQEKFVDITRGRPLRQGWL